MDFAKEKLIFLIKLVFFLYLLIFPFGQLLNIGVDYMGYSFRIHIADLIVFLASLLILTGLKKPKSFNFVNGFTLLALFTFILSVPFIELGYLPIGFFYLLRFFAYSVLIILAFNLAKQKLYKPKIFKMLTVSVLFVALLGWFQYFFLPDVRDLKYIGWDDHYYRLLGSFLDPGFTGIILVFGSLVSLSLYIRQRQKLFLIITILLALSVFFTYSRASILALTVGYTVFLYLYKKVNLLAYLLAFAVLLIFLLPRGEGEGVRLERTHSVFARLDNYTETYSIFRNYPLFGVGFNNLCAVRIQNLDNESEKQLSHACSGSDSSLLLILTTTGVVGFLVFIGASVNVLRSLPANLYANTFFASAAALFVHSLFVNSLFYPWVMGWMAILLGTSSAERKSSEF